MDLKDLQLTENDFNLLIEGLDILPEKGLTGHIMGELLEGLFADKMSPEGKAKMQAERKEREKQRKAKIDERTDDIIILKGKLAMLKRFLQTHGALKSVDDIINPL